MQPQPLDAALQAVDGRDTTVLAERTAHILWRHIGELPKHRVNALGVAAA